MFYNEDLHGLYHSSYIVRFIKSTRLKWTGHVVRMKEGKYGRSALNIGTGKNTRK